MLDIAHPPSALPLSASAVAADILSDSESKSESESSGTCSGSLLGESQLVVVAVAAGQLCFGRAAHHHEGDQGQLQHAAHTIGDHIHQMLHYAQIQTHFQLHLHFVFAFFSLFNSFGSWFLSLGVLPGQCLCCRLFQMTTLHICGTVFSPVAAAAARTVLVSYFSTKQLPSGRHNRQLPSVGACAAPICSLELFHLFL